MPLSNEEVEQLRDGLELDLAQSYPLTAAEIREVCDELLTLRDENARPKQRSCKI